MVSNNAKPSERLRNVIEREWAATRGRAVSVTEYKFGEGSLWIRQRIQQIGARGGSEVLVPLILIPRVVSPEVDQKITIKFEARCEEGSLDAGEFTIDVRFDGLQAVSPVDLD